MTNKTEDRTNEMVTVHITEKNIKTTPREFIWLVVLTILKYMSSSILSGLSHISWKINNV